MECSEILARVILTAKTNRRKSIFYSVLVNQRKTTKDFFTEAKKVFDVQVVVPSIAT